MRCNLYLDIIRCNSLEMLLKEPCFGAERPISFCRELTKLHEEVIRTTLGQAIDFYEQTPPKGEFVLVVAGAAKEEKALPSQEDAKQMVLMRWKESDII